MMAIQSAVKQRGIQKLEPGPGGLRKAPRYLLVVYLCGGKRETIKTTDQNARKRITETTVPFLWPAAVCRSHSKSSTCLFDWSAMLRGFASPTRPNFELLPCFEVSTISAATEFELNSKRANRTRFRRKLMFNIAGSGSMSLDRPTNRKSLSDFSVQLSHEKTCQLSKT